jgi:hypothetical protein
LIEHGIETTYFSSGPRVARCLPYVGVRDIEMQEGGVCVLCADF